MESVLPRDFKVSNLCISQILITEVASLNLIISDCGDMVKLPVMSTSRRLKG